MSTGYYITREKDSLQQVWSHREKQWLDRDESKWAGRRYSNVSTAKSTAKILKDCWVSMRQFGGFWKPEPTKNPAAVALGKLGGKSKSAAKLKAAAKNARLGGWPKGRPRKVVEPQTPNPENP